MWHDPFEARECGLHLSHRRNERLVELDQPGEQERLFLGKRSEEVLQRVSPIQEEAPGFVEAREQATDWSMLVKRAETFGHDDRVRQICLCTFVEEGTDGGGEGGAQRVRLYGAGAGAVETGESVRRKVVVASRLHSRQPATQARERQGVVAHGADIMLGLPDTAALDARACVKRVDDAPPEDVRRDRRRGNEQTPRLPGNLGLASSRLAKEKPESWTRWTKVGRGRHRKVELKRVRQQEYAVDGRIVHKIGEL